MDEDARTYLLQADRARARAARQRRLPWPLLALVAVLFGAAAAAPRVLQDLLPPFVALISMAVLLVAALLVLQLALRRQHGRIDDEATRRIARRTSLLLVIPLLILQTVVSFADPSPLASALLGLLVAAGCFASLLLRDRAEAAHLASGDFDPDRMR